MPNKSGDVGELAVGVLYDNSEISVQLDCVEDHLMEKLHTRKYVGLQLLRIVAAFLVLVTHSTFYASERLDKGFHFWPRGATGVDIFFVLSGFVMIYSSSNLMSHPDGWKIFAERRIARIVPMYWLATTVKVATLLLSFGLVLHARLSWTTSLCSYLFIPHRNIDGDIEPLLGVGWTLNFEMFFYLLFTLALFFKTNVYRFVGIVLAVLACGAYFREPAWPPVSFYLNTISLEFLLGMLIAHQCLKGRHLPPGWSLTAVCAGFAILVAPQPDFNAPRVLLMGIPAALIIWGTASLEDYLQGIPKWALYLADSSYVIYLFHPEIAPLVPAVLVKLHYGHPWLSVVASVLLALVVGVLIHRLVEVPATNFLSERLRVHHQRIIQRAA